MSTHCDLHKTLKAYDPVSNDSVTLRPATTAAGSPRTRQCFRNTLGEEDGTPKRTARRSFFGGHFGIGGGGMLSYIGGACLIPLSGIALARVGRRSLLFEKCPARLFGSSRSMWLTQRMRATRIGVQSKRAHVFSPSGSVDSAPGVCRTGHRRQRTPQNSPLRIK